MLVFYWLTLAPLWQYGLLFTLLLTWLTCIAAQDRAADSYLVFDQLYRKPKSSSGPVAKLRKTVAMVCRYQGYFSQTASILEQIDNLLKYALSHGVICVDMSCSVRVSTGSTSNATFCELLCSSTLLLLCHFCCHLLCSWAEPRITAVFLFMIFAVSVLWACIFILLSFQYVHIHDNC